MAKDDGKILYGAAQLLADSARNLVMAANAMVDNQYEQTDVLKDILEKLGDNNKKDKDSNKDITKSKTSLKSAIGLGGDGLKGLGAGLSEFAVGVREFYKERKKIDTVESFMQSIDELVKGMDLEALASAQQGLKHLGTSIHEFGKDVAKAGIYMVFAYPGLSLLPGMVQKITTALKDVENDTYEKADVVSKTAVSMSSAAIALAKSAPFIPFALLASSSIPKIFNSIAETTKLDADPEKARKFYDTAWPLFGTVAVVALIAPFALLALPASYTLPAILSNLSKAYSVQAPDAGVASAMFNTSLYAAGSVAILALAAPFVIFALPVSLLLPMIFSGLNKAYTTIGENSEAIMEGVKAAAWMGLATIAVAGSLAVAGALIAQSSMLGVTVVVGSVALLAYMYSQIGAAKEPVMSGVQVAAWMGLTTLGVGMALALTMYAVGGNIANYALVALITTGSIALLAYTFSIVGQAKDSILEGASVVAWMGLGVLALGGALALTTLLVGGNILDYALTALITAGSVALMAFTFAQIGESKMKKDILEGSLVSVWMGLGILAVGGSLALTTLLMGGDITTYALTALVTAGAMGLMALTFALIGQAEVQIAKGILVMIGGGIALLAVGAALALFQEFGVTLQTVGAAVGALIGVATALALAGALGGQVIAGALALAIGGVAIATIALGLAAFDYFGVTMDTALSASGAIIAVSGAMVIAGLASIPMLLGAAGLIAVSLSLLTLAGGLIVMNAVYEKVSKGLLAPNKSNPNKSNLEFVIDGVVSSMSINVLDSIAMFVGGVALVSASIALATIAGGLALFNMSYQYFKPLFESGNGTFPEYGDTILGNTMGAIVKAMSINVLDSIAMFAGGVALVGASIALLTMSAGLATFNASYQYSKSLFEVQNGNFPEYGNTVLGNTMGAIVKAMSINVLDSVAIFLGSVALVGASVALLTMSGGLLAFNYAYQKFNESGLFTDKGEGVPFVNTMNALIDGMVISPLRLIGLYAAFPAWIGAGVALISIGAGISKFVEMVEKNIDINKVGSSVASVLGSVAGAIIDVYNTGIDWDNVEDGLDAFGEVGNVIVGLAEGVAKMAELKFPIYGEGGKITGYFGVSDKQFEQVSANIKLLMTTVGDALSEIGRSQGETSWFSKSDAEKGKEIIQGIGGDLVGIVDFVQKAATLTFPIYDSNGKQIGTKTLDPSMLEKGGQVYRNIVAMVRSVSDALAEIGSGAAAQSGWFSESDIEKGKVAIQGVAGDISGIAELVKSVATVENFEDVEYRIKRTIALIPESIMAVSAFVQQNKAILETTAQTITGLIWGPVNAITEILGRVVEKGITEATGKSLGSSIASIINGFAGLDPNAAAYNGLWSMTAFLDKLVAAESPISKLATSLEKINKSFGGFAATFKKMSTDTLKNTDLLLKTMVDLSKVQPGSFDTVTTAAKKFVEFVYDRAESLPIKPPGAGGIGTYTPPGATNTVQPTPYTPGVQAQPNQVQQQKAAQDQQIQQRLFMAEQVNLDLQKQMSEMNGKLQRLIDIMSGTIKVKGSI